MEEFTKEYVLMWKNWNDFDGKAGIREFWMAFLIHFIVGAVLGAIGGAIPILAVLGSIYGLVALIPFIAVMIRRFHDAGHSGWNVLWWFLLFIGWVIAILRLIKEPA